jgi:hypothetical protein
MLTADAVAWQDRSGAAIHPAKAWHAPKKCTFKYLEDYALAGSHSVEFIGLATNGYMAI